MACVRSFDGVGIYNPCAAFVVLMGKPTGGREIPPPRAITIKTERKIMWKENHSEKDAHYALALALALSLTACGQPNAEQPTDPAPSTSVPEPIAPPEPIKDPAPESEPEQTPAAPVETEDTQPPEETESQEDEVQLFTEVNETVYATGTVNLRSGPSTAHDKVGSLNKSDSVTRVGIGTAEAEGWSRIQLSDGSIVYVSNKYLSTTKPVVQQQQTSKPSGGGNTTTQGGGQQQTPPQQQTSGSSDPDMAEIEQAMKEQLLKDREEAKANGANFGGGDPLSNEDIEKIGEALNTGLMP